MVGLPLVCHKDHTRGKSGQPKGTPLPNIEVIRESQYVQKKTTA